jgi:hypothetical protein
MQAGASARSSARLDRSQSITAFPCGHHTAQTTQLRLPREYSLPDAEDVSHNDNSTAIVNTLRLRLPGKKQIQNEQKESVYDTQAGCIIGVGNRALCIHIQSSQLGDLISRKVARK